jgi:hypothetical protein
VASCTVTFLFLNSAGGGADADDTGGSICQLGERDADDDCDDGRIYVWEVEGARTGIDEKRLEVRNESRSFDLGLWFCAVAVMVVLVAVGFCAKKFAGAVFLLSFWGLPRVEGGEMRR